MVHATRSTCGAVYSWERHSDLIDRTLLSILFPGLLRSIRRWDCWNVSDVLYNEEIRGTHKSFDLFLTSNDYRSEFLSFCRIIQRKNRSHYEWIHQSLMWILILIYLCIILVNFPIVLRKKKTFVKRGLRAECLLKWII